MKTRLLFLMVLTAALFSCTRSRYATVGAYESDDAYYTSSDTYIADFALVDDEAQMATSSDSSSTTTSSDDYYDPNYSSSPAFSPNTHSNNWSADPWNSGYNSCGNSFGSGFGNYNYGSHWNCNPYMIPSVGWNPYSGYYSNFTFVYGYNSFYNPYSTSPFGYNPYNSWYTPYYMPNYYNGWAYNPWYSPFNYSSLGNNDGIGGSVAMHGPRNPITTISATNSSYSSGLFYNGTKKDLHSYVNTLQDNTKPNTSTGGNVAPVTISKPSKPSASRPSNTFKPVESRPAYTPTKPNRDRSIAKPGITKPREIAPTRDRINNTSPRKDTGRPATPRTDRPVREYNPAPSRETPSRPRTETPTRSTPRSESSPSRSETSPPRSSGSSSSPAPSRSSGGSSNSPRRK